MTLKLTRLEGGKEEVKFIKLNDESTANDIIKVFKNANFL